MAAATLREMVSDRSLKSGTLVWEFATPGIGHLLRAAGCDFVFLCAEHSGFGIDTVKTVLRFFEAANIPALVRPAGKTYPHVANALDVGAEGLILPMVGSGEEARRIVEYARYAPQGARGVGLGIGHDRYAPGPVAESLARANERTVLFALVETAQGVENVEDIAATQGIDGLWIGHLDLSTSLGIPGQFQHPDYVAAVERIERAAAGAGKSLGRAVGDAAEGAALHPRGYDFIALKTDTALYLDALSEAVRGLRDACDLAGQEDSRATRWPGRGSRAEP